MAMVYYFSIRILCQFTVLRTFLHHRVTWQQYIRIVLCIRILLCIFIRILLCIRGLCVSAVYATQSGYSKSFYGKTMLDGYRNIAFTLISSLAAISWCILDDIRILHVSACIRILHVLQVCVCVCVCVCCSFIEVYIQSKDGEFELLDDGNRNTMQIGNYSITCHS